MVSYGIMTICRCNEVTWDQFGPLVDQLVKCMLSIGARLTPDDRSGLVIHVDPFSIYKLSVALHISLLEISSKPVQVLIVW